MTTDDTTPQPADATAETAAAGVDRHDLPVVPVDLRDYVSFSQQAATRVRVHATDTLATDLWCVEPQQATDVLRYPDADVTYTILGGRSWFVTEEGEVGLDPMGSLLVRRGVHHGIDNRGTDPLIVLASISPPDDLDRSDPVDERFEAIRPDDTSPGQKVARALRGILSGRTQVGRDR